MLTLACDLYEINISLIGGDNREKTSLQIFPLMQFLFPVSYPGFAACPFPQVSVHSIVNEYIVPSYAFTLV